MFMPAGKLVEGIYNGSIGSVDKPYYDDVPHMERTKLHQASRTSDDGRLVPAGHPNSLKNSIRREGIREPVEMGHSRDDMTPTLTNGHHRVFAANDLDPKTEVPLYHWGKL